MDLILKKTDELKVSEKKDICKLFARVFQKPKTLDQFDREFSGTPTGYSYHGLMIDSYRIVGCYTAIPLKYRYFEDDITFALSVDTMIDENYRGNPFKLKQVAHRVYGALKQEGIPFVFGFPNENIYLVRKRVLHWRDIGRLNFYILPLNLGSLNRALVMFNRLTKWYCQYVNWRVGEVETHSGMNWEEFDPSVSDISRINDDQFIKYRFSDDKYSLIRLSDQVFFVYTIVAVGDISVAYIVDVNPLEKRLLEMAVRHVATAEKEIDVIMYVGKLTFRPKNLLQIPEKMEPKAIRMAGLILDETAVDDRVFNFDNWAVNLADFDVV